MGQHIPEVFLWLFVINHGIALGAGLYEHRIVVPQWISRSGLAIRVNSRAMRESDPGRRFWAFVTTGPLTLLTLANLVVAFQAEGPRYHWWLGAAAITLVERVVTFSYFMPTAIRLARADEISPAPAASMAVRWMMLNYVRLALALIGWLAALRALSLPAL